MFLTCRSGWALVALASLGCGSSATGSSLAGTGGGPPMGAGPTDASVADATPAEASFMEASFTDAGLLVAADGPAPPPDGDASCPPLPPETGDCAAPLTPGADRKCTLMIAGQAREVLLYAPASYDPCHPASLVVDAHGSNETDAEQAGLQPFLNWPGGLGSGWRLVADREGFLVAQPQGIGDAWPASDADFMLAIPAWVAGVANVDPARVYMTGISNGGGLTYWTGCKDKGVFQGFAPVSGYGDATCAAQHPAPLIHFHSPDDKLVPYAQGQAAFQTWVVANHCQRGPTPSMQFGGPNTDPRPFCLTQPSPTKWALTTCGAAAPVSTCEVWDQCDAGITATFCTVAPDMVDNYALTGGHILYINGTSLSLAALAWALLHGP